MNKCTLVKRFMDTNVIAVEITQHTCVFFHRICGIFITYFNLIFKIKLYLTGLFYKTVLTTVL